RVITGAIVQRQSFGGWKKSAVGPGTKAGGPSYLFGLGTWTDAPRVHKSPASPSGIATDSPETCGHVADAASRRAVKVAPAEDREWIEAALATDIAAYDTEFGVARDVQ